MGPPWPWRPTPGSAWTEMAPYTSHRRGQGTLAHTPAGYSQLAAMTLEMLTCASGKDKVGVGGAHRDWQQWHIQSQLAPFGHDKKSCMTRPTQVP